VKTRLAAAVGDEAAFRLHRAMVADGRDRLRRAARAGWEVKILWADGPPPSPALRARLRRRPGEGLQHGADLGERMAAALEEGLGTGSPACVLIGTDSPTLRDERLTEAREALRRVDLVFGPADDGGYYLVGARRPVPEVFRGLPWGTGGVLAGSLAAAEAAGADVALLAPHFDVDEAPDLERLRRELAAGGAATARHTGRALREMHR
jgi:rSAM/selenodomain-associated transferase 1